MNFTTSLAVGLTIMFVLMIGLQKFLQAQMAKSKGQPAPQLDGDHGAAIASNEASVFYFFTPSCNACRVMTPVVKKMATTNDKVFPVDVSQDMATAQKFGVMATPTTIVVKEGIIAEILVGAQSRSKLEALMG